MIHMFFLRIERVIWAELRDFFLHKFFDGVVVNSLFDEKNWCAPIGLLHPFHKIYWLLVVSSIGPTFYRMFKPHVTLDCECIFWGFSDFVLFYHQPSFAWIHLMDLWQQFKLFSLQVIERHFSPFINFYPFLHIISKVKWWAFFFKNSIVLDIVIYCWSICMSIVEPVQWMDGIKNSKHKLNEGLMLKPCKCFYLK